MLIVTDGAVDVPDDVTASELVRQVPGEVRGVDGPARVDRDEFGQGCAAGITRPPARPP